MDYDHDQNLETISCLTCCKLQPFEEAKCTKDSCENGTVSHVTRGELHDFPPHARARQHPMISDLWIWRSRDEHILSAWIFAKYLKLKAL